MEKSFDGRNMIIADSFIYEAISDFKCWTFDGLYNKGNPIPESNHTENVRSAFNIPIYDKIFFAVCADILNRGFKSDSKGFALASHGFYFRDEKKGAE